MGAREVARDLRALSVLSYFNSGQSKLGGGSWARVTGVISLMGPSS